MQEEIAGQKITGEILNRLDSFTSLTSLLDIERIWNNVLNNTNLVRELGIFCCALAFTMLCVAIIQSIIRSGTYRPSDHYVLIAKTILVSMFFGVFYSTITAPFIIDVTVALNDHFAGGAVREFRSQLRALFFSYQALPEDAGIIKKVVRFISNIFTLVKYFSAPVDVAMLVIAMQMLIAFIFLIMSIGPFFVFVALLMGPICMGLSIAFPSIAYSWLRFLLSAVFFSMIVAVGIMAISTTGTITMATTYIGASQQLMAVIMVLFVLVFLSMVPFVIAQIFSVRAYSFLGTFLGWLYGLSGVFLPVTCLTTALKYTVDVNIGRSTGLSRDMQLLHERNARK